MGSVESGDVWMESKEGDGRFFVGFVQLVSDNTATTLKITAGGLCSACYTHQCFFEDKGIVYKEWTYSGGVSTCAF